MRQEEFAARAEAVKARLYRTAYLYLGSEADALEAVDETVYQALRKLKQLRQPEKRIIRPTSGTLRLSDRVLPVDGLPLALEAGRGVERRVTWTIEKRKINFGKACW